MEFYHYIPLLTIVALATFAGVRSYLRERRQIKRRQGLTKKNSTSEPAQQK